LNKAMKLPVKEMIEHAENCETDGILYNELDV
jgi:hypothetical protein